MTNVKKSCRFGWTNGCRAIILYALCLNSSVFSSLATADDSLSPTRTQDRPPESAADGEGAECCRELARVRRQLEAMRLLYAELYLESKGLAEELAGLRLHLANLLGEEPEASEERRQQAALAALLEVGVRHEELYREIFRFGDYLQSVLELVEPSQSLRREIERRYADLTEAVERLELLPSIVAERGGAGWRDREEARILHVEEELRIVILGAGEQHRVAAGSVWTVQDETARTVVRLKVIETRARISAAIPIEGEPERLRVGMRARLTRVGQQ